MTNERIEPYSLRRRIRESLGEALLGNRSGASAASGALARRRADRTVRQSPLRSVNRCERSASGNGRVRAGHWRLSVFVVILPTRDTGISTISY
jgi:hypothetical protein